MSGRRHPSRGGVRDEVDDLLDEVRSWIWTDLDHSLDWPDSVGVENLVHRLRVIGRFAGRPTPFEKVPMTCLRWYEVIEYVPEVGLWPERVPWDTFGTDWGVGVMLRDVPEDAPFKFARLFSIPDDYDGDEPVG